WALASGAVATVQQIQKVLSAACVHQRVKPRQHEDAAGSLARLLDVERQDAERRLAPRIDRRVELRGQHALEVLSVGEHGPPHRRRLQGLARPGGPVKLAPGKWTPEARRGPWRTIEKPIQRASDLLGRDGTVALDHEQRVVAG